MSSSYFDNKQSFLEPAVRQYGSHMVMSNVMKQTRTKYVNIDTKYRDENTFQAVMTQTNNNAHRTYASCNITLPQRINDVKSITVRSAEIPMTMYNISKYLGNNVFKICHVVSGVVQSTLLITIPNGNYTTTTLIQKIGNIINALDPESIFRTDMTFVIDEYNHIKISSSYSQFSVYFNVNSSGVEDNHNLRNKLGWILGFRKSNYQFSVGVDAYSEEALCINQSNYIYLTIDEFSKGNQQSFITPLQNSLISKNVISKIIYNATIYSYGSVIPANTFNGYLLSDKREYNGKVDIQKLLVQLVDEQGRLVDLNGADFSFTMEVEYE